MPDSDRTNPYVFVVGCPRSGTTLLQRMLDNHPELCVANDTHFITRAAKRTLRSDPDPKMTPDLLREVLGYRRFYRMGLDDAEVEGAAAGCRTYGEFVSRLYDLRAARFGKPYSGEKTPDFCRQIPLLHALCPQTKFVHITRDGRDTALSAMNWATRRKGPGKWRHWAQDPVASSALWWQWQAGAGVRDGRGLEPGCYHELRYEKLVEEPEAQLSKVADFLQIPDSGKMSRFYEGKTRRNPNLSAKSAWLPPTAGLRDWRSQMSEEDVSVFEGIASGLLEHLGYELSGGTPGRRATDRIDRALAWWERQPMSRA